MAIAQSRSWPLLNAQQPVETPPSTGAASAPARVETALAPADPLRELRTNALQAWYGSKHVLKGVSIEFPPRTVTAIIGPSGCGKSTLLRSINRMHELTPGCRVEGNVMLDGQNIYAEGVDPVWVRSRLGMVFQRPVPLPGMSIAENVTVGLRLTGRQSRSKLREVVETALVKAALWDEVKDRLDTPGEGLSGGQQQRLCIARALAVEPQALLMDEPCSALDPVATDKIEDLIDGFRGHYTVAIVTHNLQQAARVADHTIVLNAGLLVEQGPTQALFTHPREKWTQDYITGRFG